MKYFLDTEFHEYKKKPLFNKGIDTIELISIGVVSEDDREYYGVCNEFDLKAAWNNEWLKENVLKPIWIDLNQSMSVYHKTYFYNTTDWSYKGMKRLLKWRGKSKKQIAEDINAFIYKDYLSGTGLSYPESFNYSHPDYDPEFYAYYADYDWVVFCWLFGRMIDLPKGFPMYCKDLKQMLDEKSLSIYCNNGTLNSDKDVNKRVDYIKSLDGYPKQENEHNALDDAKWNKELYKFLT